MRLSVPKAANSVDYQIYSAGYPAVPSYLVKNCIQAKTVISTKYNKSSQKIHDVAITILMP